MTAASYRHGEETVASISTARTVDELRAGTAYQVVTVEQAADRVRQGKTLPLLPLCGGLSPSVAWPYLERAADAVEHALKPDPRASLPFTSAARTRGATCRGELVRGGDAGDADDGLRHVQQLNDGSGLHVVGGAFASELSGPGSLGQDRFDVP